MVVLGGSCAKDFGFWEGGVGEGLKRTAHPRARERLRIKVSRHLHIAGLGEAALGLNVVHSPRD